MDKAKVRSLIIIIIFTLILFLPVTYIAVKNYFFTPNTEVKPAAPAANSQSK